MLPSLEPGTITAAQQGLATMLKASAGVPPVLTHARHLALDVHGQDGLWADLQLGSMTSEQEELIQLEQ